MEVVVTSALRVGTDGQPGGGVGGLAPGVGAITKGACSSEASAEPAPARRGFMKQSKLRNITSFEATWTLSKESSILADGIGPSLH
jgi:hypothetical protein